MPPKKRPQKTVVPVKKYQDEEDEEEYNKPEPVYEKKSTKSSKYKMPDYEKEPGPMGKRKCRDVFFLILYLLFWAVMFYLGSIAIRKGDPNKLIIPSDRLGNFCGVNNVARNTSLRDLSSKPVLYFFSPFDASNSAAYCIDACPTTTGLTSLTNKICAYDTNPTTTQELATAVTDGKCAPFVLKSESVLGRCVPVEAIQDALVSQAESSFSIDIGSTSVNTNDLVTQGKNIAYQVVADIVKTWQIIAVGGGVAFVLCLIWVILMRYFAGGFAYFTVIAGNIATWGFSAWLGYVWWTKNASVAGTDPLKVLQADLYQRDGSLIWFIVSLCVSFIIFCITIAVRKKVALAVSIVKEASKAIAKMPAILLLPFFQFIWFGGLFLYFVWVLLYMITADDQFVLGADFGVTFTSPYMNNFFLIYHTFGFLWGNAFLTGVFQVTIAGAIASWYWTMDKRDVPRLPVLNAMGRTAIYHLGSIAFGSLFIGLVQLLSLLLYVVRQRSKEAQRIKIVAYILACLQCCLKCVEFLVKWFNKNAYIYIAINGTNFCTSSFAAAALIIRNFGRMLTVNLMADFVLFLAKVFIAAIVTGAAWAVITFTSILTVQLNFTIVPALVIGLEAYLITSVFFGVYHMAIDTIFLCYLEDCERNDGSDERPFYFESSLRQIAEPDE